MKPRLVASGEWREVGSFPRAAWERILGALRPVSGVPGFELCRVRIACLASIQRCAMRTLQLGLLLACLAYSNLAPAIENAIPLSPEQATHLGIRTVRPEPVATLPLAQAPGRVVLPPAKEFVVSASQTGVISHVGVPLGVQVAKGQVLAQIRSADLLAAQRELLDAATRFNLAEAKLKRDRTLLSEGIISKLRFQEAQSEFDQAQSALRAAEQTLIAGGMVPAEVEKLKATHTLDSTLDVQAPITGVVLERMAVVGQRVDMLAPLFRIGQLDELWLEVDMPQERLHEIRIGDRVTVENPKAAARIIEVGQHVNPESQTALVRAVVEDGAGELRPGMNLNVQIMHKSTDRLFKVPASALVSHEGRTYVFVKTAQGFEARPVAVAGQEAYSVAIHGGLQGGEELAVQGVAGLKAAWLGIGEGE
jgi:cobalt-zinc-cadmium efflux system membrane fusion protein